MQIRASSVARLSIPLFALGAAACTVTGPAPEPRAPQSALGFFVTSVGSGRGGDFGGLAGADAHCQTLAATVGAGQRTWRAYLSTTATGGKPAVNARDRIGKGPWRNARGDLIAGSVAELHGANNLAKHTALTEKGEMVNGRGDTPNRHDILTGSQPDGTAFPTAGSFERTPTDTTCGNWTTSSGGSAIVGHHDRMGLQDDLPSRSWNSSHATKGCSVAELRSTGGDGLLYCFAN